MRKIVLVNGLISGAIVITVFMIHYPFMRNGTLSMDYSMIIGYTSMVISFSMIFFAIKTYRDQFGAGTITFGTGAKIGLMITGIASVIYALGWEVFSTFFASDFQEFYAQCYIDKVKASGADAAAIEAARAEMAQFAALYSNPLIRFGMTLSEILPVGIIVTLISAGILRKREILPA
jgi:hypothetical protein